MLTTSFHEGAQLRPDRLAPEIQRFVEAHRAHGHRHAALDPLGLSRPLEPQGLSLQRFGLSPGDALTHDGAPWLGARDAHELDRRLKAAYCGPLALDASAVRDDARRAWLHARMEAAPSAAPVGTELLDRLIQVQAWEHHLAARFPHAKRFSLEGCEALLPLLDALLERAASHGVGEVFMGMPHRGRVNVLVNLLGLPAAEAMGYLDPQARDPEQHLDLVYHLGGHRRIATRHGEIALTLAHNPSHLQSVYPVVAGMARASQARHGDAHAMAIVLHGDAAFAGQGVVMETLALTQKPGYASGGLVHVIINNQLGFTEPNAMDAQAARYCTDVTRMVDAPVLRVNADAPELLLRAAQVALAYRAQFGTDIVIDLIGYRRLGHSEHDLPALTSPGVYPRAELKPSVVEVHAAALVAAGIASDAEMVSHIAGGRARAIEAFSGKALAGNTSADDAAPNAGVASRAPWSRERLQAAVTAMTTLPAGFQPHPVIHTMMQQWSHAAGDDAARIDWRFAENMAYASLLDAGTDVRVSGLDVRRGTFMHRHAVWHNQAATGPGSFTPLQQVGAGRARFDVVNSVLSEEAVLGFEYGYSVQDAGRGLTIWEAQFGDFVNGAQVYVDQYISAGEAKWGCRSALAMLLPHGYEGVGPEHSNAFLGRFLQLCGEDNLRVAFPSTSAQWFHLLRRQALDAQARPLVVMTPKGALYGESASHSTVGELLSGRFEPVLDDAECADASQVTRVIVCSGKLYYDLHCSRVAQGRADVAIVRLEQLYPFPQAALRAVLQRYPRRVDVVWAQEETRNQGAWAFVRDDLADACPHGVALREVSRAVTAAGAVSSHAVHQRQQQALVERALGG
jgi:2-oxoglutarate dehydrogenase E1 component